MTDRPGDTDVVISSTRDTGPSDLSAPSAPSGSDVNGAEPTDAEVDIAGAAAEDVAEDVIESFPEDASEDVAENARKPVDVATGRTLGVQRNHGVRLVVAAVVGLGLAAAVHTSAYAAIGAVAGAQLLLIVSWVFGTGLPGRSGAIVAGIVAAGAADALVTRWPHGQLGTLIAVLGLAVPVMFVHQLARGAGRVRVVESLSDIALLLIATTALAALAQLRNEVGGPLMATTVALAMTAALVAGHFVDLIWSRPRFDPAVARGVPAVVVSVVAGATVAVIRLRGAVEFTGGRALVLGCVLAMVTALFAVGAAFIEQTSTLPASGLGRWMRPIFSVLLCFALTCPVAYLLCLAIRS